ncbi:hypothetical protein VKT23_015711 [Stygiomarasmius scandens]|uniref:DUF8212 domain-containing protein n=1 Tax=Marasmiellus scandens TaxID=2682957 RepID=A0ABR1J1I4_9AGAR
MSPIYGEGGAKAFMRLQQEIIKISDDRSIFAWTASDRETEPRGLLARSPYEFRASVDVRMLEFGIPAAKSSFSFNNNGLHIHIPLISTNLREDDCPVFLSSLHCRSENDGKHLSIYLKMTFGGRYIRCRPSEILLGSLSSSGGNLQEVVVKETRPCQRTTPRRYHEFASGLSPVERGGVAYCGDIRHCGWIGLKPVHNFYYRTPREGLSILTVGTNFTVITNATSPNIAEVLQNGSVVSPLISELDQSNRRPDRHQTPIESGMISLVLQITGRNRRLEVHYLSQKDSPSLMKQVTFPKSGFLISGLPLMSGPTLAPIEVNVYPYNNFLYQGPKLDLSDKIYLSIPETNQASSFRLLSISAHWLQSYVFIAVGFHDSKPWTDVVVFDNDEKPPKIEEIWKSYLDCGSRAHTRLACQQTSITEEMWSQAGMGYWLSIAAGERRDLDLGTHFLRLQFEENEINL